MVWGPPRTSKLKKSKERWRDVSGRPKFFVLARGGAWGSLVGLSGLMGGQATSSSAFQLDEPLPFLRKAFSSEEDLLALDVFRKNYQDYRSGAVVGARGERPLDRRSEVHLVAKLAATVQMLAAAEHEVRVLREASRELEALRRQYTTSDEELTLQQRESRQWLREECGRRSRERSMRVEASMAQISANPAAGTIQCSKYDFVTGAPVTTDVLVARGVVANPGLAAFEIIPAGSASSPIFVFTDETVNGLYGAGFVGGLLTMGYRVHKVVVPDGEDAKTLAVYNDLCEHVLAEGIDKFSVLISLGGGAVANVCGFIASTLHRGVGLIHFPTTLLAQCDAAISHKQAVNAAHGKNLVGSYYAPIRIVVDPDVLQTLDDWLLPDGMGEIVKHALCQDLDLLHTLEVYNGPLTDPDFLEDVVRRTIRLKCEVLNIDAKEKREATVLIYGHTLGHPIEAISHRAGSLCCLSHGQAVAIGCVVAARVAADMGLCDAACVDRTLRLCEKYHLPTQIPPDQSIRAIMAKLPFNKTWTTEGNHMCLLEDIGRLFNVDAQYMLPVDDAVIERALVATMAPPGTQNIKGAGSSGFLRREKKKLLVSTPSRASPEKQAFKAPLLLAKNTVPGTGWADDGANHEC